METWGLLPRLGQPARSLRRFMAINTRRHHTVHHHRTMAAGSHPTAEVANRPVAAEEAGRQASGACPGCGKFESRRDG
jgi:hypothetical protein